MRVAPSDNSASIPRIASSNWIAAIRQQILHIDLASTLNVSMLPRRRICGTKWKRWQSFFTIRQGDPFRVSSMLLPVARGELPESSGAADVRTGCASCIGPCLAEGVEARWTPFRLLWLLGLTHGISLPAQLCRCLGWLRLREPRLRFSARYASLRPIGADEMVMLRRAIDGSKGSACRERGARVAEVI